MTNNVYLFYDIVLVIFIYPVTGILFANPHPLELLIITLNICCYGCKVADVIILVTS